MIMMNDFGQTDMDFVLIQTEMEIFRNLDLARLEGCDP